MYRFEILHEESDVIYTLADQVLILFWILNGNIKSVNSHKFLQNEGHFLRKVTHYQIFNQKKKIKQVFGVCVQYSPVLKNLLSSAEYYKYNVFVSWKFINCLYDNQHLLVEETPRIEKVSNCLLLTQM